SPGTAVRSAMRVTFVALTLLLGASGSIASAAPATASPARDAPTREICAARQGEVFVPAGKYRPFFKRAQRRPLIVAPMCLGDSPVTNGQYLEFVRRHPEWRKSRIARLFAEESYLASWRNDLSPPPDSLSVPVTQVSWFAAGAYCESR